MHRKSQVYLRLQKVKAKNKSVFKFSIPQFILFFLLDYIIEKYILNGVKRIIFQKT